jgi:hypothetical protein
VLRRRWRWVESCDGWAAFVAWRDGRPWPSRVELAAGLEVLLRYGPEHDAYQIGEDLYVVYACAEGTVLWLCVGVASPGDRRLLPLGWGRGSPSKKMISRAAAKGARKLQEWRTANQGDRT